MPVGPRGSYAGRVPLPRVARTRSGHVWGETWRLLVALLFGLLVWWFMWLGLDRGDLSARFGGSWLWVDLALGLLAVAALPVRRRWPVATALGTALASGLGASAIGASGVALVSLATRRRWRELVVMVVPWMAAGYANQVVYPARQDETLTNVAIGVLTYVAAIGIGWAIGERRAFVASLQERAITAEREQAMRVVQAQVAERARIAREMHDVLAHRISLVAMHSGALTYRTDLSPDEVAATAEVVRSNANQALTELRAVLGVLRDVPTTTDPSPAGAAPDAPQPTLCDLDALVEETRSSGADVRCTVDGDTALVPSGVSRSCYRIVQECLTNARKHAPRMPVQVTVRVSAHDGHGSGRGDTGTGAVSLTVRNGIPVLVGRDTAKGTAAPTGSGLGLVGITERAVLAGGELTYGPDRRGDFVVQARLPWSA
ncbi:signal transduction histidine kinase [Terracoccus luteus]|uniref:histidine kinase n=1 Tax=Terracoccus luteus TaxID=53356 RepID=A0A495Y3X8_9MICO|nr:signal transduction histidine kinase [Terracoccus luteus]